MTYFLSIKKIFILKSVGNQTDLFAIDFHCMDIIEVKWNQNYLVTNIIKIILFCVLQKSVSHTGSERDDEGK